MNRINKKQTQLAKRSRRYRYRRSGERFFLQLTKYSLPGGVALCTLGLLSRLLLPELLYSLALIPLWILGVVFGLLMRPNLWIVPEWQAEAQADMQSGSRGTFMALQEARGEGWNDCLGEPEYRLPLSLPWKEGLKWLVAGAAILAILLMPDLRPPKRGSGSPVTPLGRIENLVATVKDEDLAKEEDLEQIEELLERIKEDARGTLREEDWQSLDGLSDLLEKETADTYRKLLEGQGEFASLRNALEGALNPESIMEKAAEHLSNLSEKEGLERFGKAAEAMGLTPRKLKELIAKCREREETHLGEDDFSAFTEAERSFLESVGKKMRLSSEVLRKLAELFEGVDFKTLANLCNLTEEELRNLLSKCKGGKGNFTMADLEKLRALLEAMEKGSMDKLELCAELLKKMGA